MDLGLKNKVAIVTGASKGIGRAIAEGLAAEGVHLVICARDKAKLEECAKEIRDLYPVSVLAVPADLSHSEEIDHILKEAKKSYGGVDILINNAGIGGGETIMNAPDEKWQYYWDLHVMASIRLARGVVPLMNHRGGGVILHNASINAKQPSATEPIYNVTKAALAMFSKCLANEVIKQNIRVNCINPGYILTEGWIEIARQEVEGSDMNWKQWIDQLASKDTPIGRFATPQELADFFVFLCSDRASYCVGSEYFIDGGWLNVVA